MLTPKDALDKRGQESDAFIKANIDMILSQVERRIIDLQTSDFSKSAILIIDLPHQGRHHELIALKNKIEEHLIQNEWRITYSRIQPNNCLEMLISGDSC